MGVFEQFIASILGKGLAEMGLVLAIWLQQFHHRGVGVLVNVLDEAREGHGQGWGGVGCHIG